MPKASKALLAVCLLAGSSAAFAQEGPEKIRLPRMSERAMQRADRASRPVISQQLVAGEEALSMIFAATTPTQTANVVSGLKTLGAVVQERNDAIGYVRAD